MKMIKPKSLAFTVLLWLMAGGLIAQQSAWPDNWLFFPPGRAESVYRLDEDAASGTRVLEIGESKGVGGGSLIINFDMAVTEQTTLKWRWNVHSLPSTVAEDTEQTHSYLAIAVLFDNDQVLSYMWSAALPVGTVFQCPQPRWKDRETHLVMHSGTAQLEQWLDEERNLLADYARLKQGALPTAIKQVWFIVGATAERDPGAVSFSDVSFGDKAEDRRVLFSQRGLSQLDKNVATIHATLPGQWTGFTEVEDLGSGNLVRDEMTIAYTALSKDKLDYAYWGPRGLTLSHYQGDGKFLLQQWPYAGEPSTVEYQVLSVTPPDAAGNWSSDELVSVRDAEGNLQQWQQVWSLQNGELSVVRESQPDVPVGTPRVRGYRVTRSAEH